MARERGISTQLALAYETDYGTAPVSGFSRIPFIGSTISTTQELIEDDLLGLGRDPREPLLDPTTSDGDVTIPIEATSIGFWLKALFGSATSTDNGDGTYTHEWDSGAFILPSLSIEVGMPSIPRYEMFQGCMADTLSFQMARTGQLTGTVSLVAQSSSPKNASQAGPLAELSRQRFGHVHGGITRDGSLLASVVSADVSYSNNLDRVETIRSDGLIDGADPSRATLTGQIVTRFANTTLIDQATQGKPAEVSFAYTRATGETLTFTAHSVFLPRPRLPIEGPDGIQTTFDWQASYNDAKGKMCTVTLINNVESY